LIIDYIFYGYLIYIIDVLRRLLLNESRPKYDYG
jgi:hypothetical protein